MCLERNCKNRVKCHGRLFRIMPCSSDELRGADDVRTFWGLPDSSSRSPSATRHRVVFAALYRLRRRAFIRRSLIRFDSVLLHPARDGALAITILTPQHGFSVSRIEADAWRVD